MPSRAIRSPRASLSLPIAAAILLAIARGRLPRLTRRELLGMSALAATGLVLFNLFVIEGVRETDPATVGVIVGCVPVVLAIAAPLLERRPISGRVLLAGVVVSLGAAGVQWADGGITWLGLGLALGALACEASFSLFAAPHLERLGPLAVSTYACLLALPMLAAWSVVAGGVEVPRAERGRAHRARLPRRRRDDRRVRVLVHGRRPARRGARGALLGRPPGERPACSAALGFAEVTPERIAAVAVVVAGITLGVARPPRPPPSARSLAQRAEWLSFQRA